MANHCMLLNTVQQIGLKGKHRLKKIGISSLGPLCAHRYVSGDTAYAVLFWEMVSTKYCSLSLKQSSKKWPLFLDQSKCPMSPPWLLVRKRTIPTERLPLVGEF
jgi:hypothetical protein